MLSSSPVLAHPQWDRPFEIHADASAVAIGAALLQRDDDGDLRLVSYLSKTLMQ